MLLCVPFQIQPFITVYAGYTYVNVTLCKLDAYDVTTFNNKASFLTLSISIVIFNETD